jgi:hypothetical protein
MYLVKHIPERMDCSGDTSTPAEQKGERQLLQASRQEITCAELEEKRIYRCNAVSIYSRSLTQLAKYRETSTFPLRYDTCVLPQRSKKRIYYL